MTPYVLRYRKSFEKELRHVAPKVRQALVQRILSLADEPRPTGCEKLEGSNNTYRIRQGSYRVIYTINDTIIEIEVIKIGHRSDVYRTR